MLCCLPVFNQLSEALGLRLSQHMRSDPNLQRHVQLSASTYKKYFKLHKDLNLKLEQNQIFNFYPKNYGDFMSQNDKSSVLDEETKLLEEWVNQSLSEKNKF